MVPVSCITHSFGFNFLRRQRFSTSPLNYSKTLVDGINLNWEKFGNGPHVTMCLPGLVGSIAQHFVPVFKKMNLDKFTFLAWDPPGYGKSRPPDRDVFTVENPLVKDAHLARELMKKLGYDKYSVVGHSGGGMTGVFLAAAYPADVHKLVICNTRLKTDARMVKVFRLLSDLKVWSKPQLEALLQDYDKPYAEKMLKDYAKLTEQHSRSDDANKFYSAQLKKILAPTLYIKSMEDGLVPIEDVYAYGNYIQNFKVQKVAKGGHSHLDFLDDFVTATENFLTEA